MLKLEECKYPQEKIAVEKFFPEKVVIPLSQHTGALPELIVNKGDSVRIGTLLAKAVSLISANIHSSVTGKVLDIKEYNHPVLKRSRAVIIEAQSKEAFHIDKSKSLREYSSEEMLDKICQKGVVGMGGAAFPTAVKLKPPKEVDTLVVNGCECEPYLTCDHRLMLEHTEGILKGIEIVSKIIKPKKVIIAIEENKQDAVKKFNSRLHTRKYNLPEVKVQILPISYPQGAEKQLIYNTIRRVVPSGKLPFDVGCVVQNVGTLFAVYEAVYFDKPLIERIVTFTGSALAEPKNLLLPVGTLVEDLFSSGVLKFKKDAKKVISGGPMMGLSLPSLDFPIMKGTSGILFLTDDDLDLREESDCIKCGRCVDTCPMNLLPLEFPRLVKKGMYKDLEEYYISDCIECGSCTYACPAKISIVEYIKLGKAKVRELNQ